MWNRASSAGSTWWATPGAMTIESPASSDHGARPTLVDEGDRARGHPKHAPDAIRDPMGPQQARRHRGGVEVVGASLRG